MSVISDVPVEDVLPEPEVRRRPRGLGIALAVIGGAQLMIVLDGTIVNIALPHIQTDLGFSNASLSWVVNAYALALGSLLLLGGRLGDLLGRRRMFVIGVLLFAGASLVGGLAVNEAMLIASRIAQGAGAAIASPAALALITTTFPAGKERNRAMGVYAAMSGVGAAVGLILGGALTEYDWRWTFFINVPIGLLVATLAPRVLVESERSEGSFDLVGAITGTAGLVGIVYGLTHAADPAGGWGSSLTLTSLALGVVLLVTFVALRASQPARPAADPDRRRPHPRHQPVRHAAGRRGDVRDVLLPRPLHPAGARLRPAAGRVRVPAVLGGHGRRRRYRLDAGQPDRPALDLRSGCAHRRRRDVRLQPADRRQHVCRSPAAVDHRPRLRARA